MEKNFILFKNDGLKERFTSANSKKQHFYDHTKAKSTTRQAIEAYEAAADLRPEPDSGRRTVCQCMAGHGYGGGRHRFGL